MADLGVVGRGEERRNQLLRRWREAVEVELAVFGGGGVMGFEVKGPVKLRAAGYSEKFGARRSRGAEPVGGVVGSGLLASGTENADPMSERVSDRTCIRIEGAKCGTW